QHPTPPSIYTLSLHDALPISVVAEVVEVAGIHVSDEGECVELLGRERRGLLVVDDRAVLSEAQALHVGEAPALGHAHDRQVELLDRKSTRLNSSHVAISYAVF